jgi:hypothetical protein
MRGAPAEGRRLVLGDIGEHVLQIELRLEHHRAGRLHRQAHDHVSP